jgi:ketosteroid isomerase-like protein
MLEKVETKMRKAQPAKLRSFLSVVFLVLPSLCLAQPAASDDEHALWRLEHSYWDRVQANDLNSYLALWHKDFLGWPSVSAAPVRKDRITDWITAQTSKGLTFKNVDFKPAAMQVTGDVGEAYYWVTFNWVNRDGVGATMTLRVTHTWVREGKDWHIIGGMSMPESANPQK